jgi:hypothetical protein
MIAKSAAHRVGVAFGSFIDPDFVDQHALPSFGQLVTTPPPSLGR